MKPTNPLATFYNNEHEREAVKEFLVEQLKELAVERTFDGEDVKGIKEANENIVRAFDRLHELYGKIEPPKEQNSK